MSTITGLSSQSSIYSIISGLTNIARQPIIRLESKKSNLNVANAIYTDLKTKLSSLHSAVEDLADTINTPLKARMVTSTHESVIAATATSSASAASCNVFVSQLAKNHSMVSDRFTSPGTSIRTTVGTGDKTFSIIVNGETTNVTVTIDADDTNEDIIEATAAAINLAMADVDDAVTATALSDTSTTGKLVIKSDDTGLTYKMALADVTGTLLQTTGIDDESVAATDTTGGYLYADDALNAEITVDGVYVERDSNIIDDVLAEITLTLHKAQESGDAAVVLTTSPDTSSIQSTAQDFITKYNHALEYLRAKTFTDPDTGTRQALSGKFTYLNLIGTLRSTVAGSVTTGSSEINMLYHIGITPDSSGKLSLSDTEAFENALALDQEAVIALFNASDGIATRLEEIIDPFVKVGGYLANATDNISSQISSIDDRIERLEVSVAAREQRLIAQYANLQRMMAILSQQQNYLGIFMQSMGYTL